MPDGMVEVKVVQYFGSYELEGNENCINYSILRWLGQSINSISNLGTQGVPNGHIIVGMQKNYRGRLCKWSMLDI